MEGNMGAIARYFDKSEEAIERLALLNAFSRLGKPAEIAEIVCFLDSDDARWISRQIIGANGALA